MKQVNKKYMFERFKVGESLTINIMNRSTLGKIIIDTFHIVIVVGIIFINVKFLKNSIVINIFVLLLIFAQVFASNNSIKIDKETAIKIIKEHG